MTKRKVLDLFSGIGGFSLGLERTGGFETVAFCEIELFSRRVLQKHWPDVPCFEDIRDLKGKDVGTIDIITGGYPCQPFSGAGKRRGAADNRHLWPEMFRLVRELRPTWVLGENVAGHVSLGLDETLADLESEGYQTRTFVIPACAVDAPHQRYRVWIVAHADGTGGGGGCGETDGQGREPTEAGPEDVRPGDGAKRSVRADAAGEVVADAGCQGFHERRLFDDAEGQGSQQGRVVADGISEGEESERLAVADALGIGPQGQRHGGKTARPDGLRGGEGCRQGQTLPDTESHGRRQRNKDGERSRDRGGEEQGTGSGRGCGRLPEPGLGGVADGLSRWLDEPDIGRVATGVPDRVQRLRCLGNSVVPQVVEVIGQAILKGEHSD